LQRYGFHTLPQANVLPSGPRAANSHSASVGSLPPAQRQNASAASQSTNVTGSSGRSKRGSWLVHVGGEQASEATQRS